MKEPKIITIFSPNGGSGTTSLAKELAVLYAKSNLEFMNIGGDIHTENSQDIVKHPSVCIIDTDILFGDIQHMFDISKENGLNDWLEDIESQVNNNIVPKYSAEEIREKYLSSPLENVYVLSSNKTCDCERGIDISPKSFYFMIHNLKRCDFDIIIIDTPRSINDVVLYFLSKSDVSLLITGLETASIKNLKNALLNIKENNVSIENIEIIINKLPIDDMDIKIEDVECILKKEVLKTIPDYSKLRYYTNKRQFVVNEEENGYTVALKELKSAINKIYFNKK